MVHPRCLLIFFWNTRRGGAGGTATAGTSKRSLARPGVRPASPAFQGGIVAPSLCTFSGGNRCLPVLASSWPLPLPAKCDTHEPREKHGPRT
jgi:hypothetical protein